MLRSEVYDATDAAPICFGGKSRGHILLRHAIFAWDLYKICASFVRRTGICCIARQDCKAGRQSSSKRFQEFPMFVSYILAKVQAYFRYRETVRELSLLSDRELTDLGIARVQIASIARQGAAA